MIQEEFKKIRSHASVQAWVSQFGLKELRSTRRSPSVLEEWTGVYKGNAIYMKHCLMQAGIPTAKTTAAMHSLRLIISTSNGEVLTDDEVSFPACGR